MKNKLIVILGPTAVGKTGLSLKLAGELNCEIISADSMQIYKDMDIGTAKAGAEERKIVPHHMLDIISPEAEFSVSDYKDRVDKLIPSIIERNRLPLMVGGTGLYIKAVIEGFLLPEMEKDIELRKELRKMASKRGNKYVHNKLSQVDPILAEKLHPNDLRRVIRGIEIYQQTGKTKTYYRKKQENTPDNYQTLKIGLTREREELYNRINKRVDIMIEEGLIKEVKQLISRYNLSKTARQALGYKEIIGYLEGEYNLDEAIRLIKRNTRHLAKKQFTWFKRDQDINWINLTDQNPERVYKKCLSKIQDFLVD